MDVYDLVKCGVMTKAPETYQEGGLHADFTMEKAGDLVGRLSLVGARLLFRYKHADLTVKQARVRVG